MRLAHLAFEWGCLPWQLEDASERWLFTMERYLILRRQGVG